jgi:hypothetical protein
MVRSHERLANLALEQSRLLSVPSVTVRRMKYGSSLPWALGVLSALGNSVEQSFERMKAFDNEWIVRAFEDHPSFFTKRMFGGLAVYLFGRQMMLLVEPTKTGRWQWHGVLICTERALQPAIVEEFPQLRPHDILKKCLYIDSRHANFEPTLERVAEAIARDDPRFGIHPRPRKERTASARRRRG